MHCMTRHKVCHTFRGQTVPIDHLHGGYAFCDSESRILDLAVGRRWGRWPRWGPARGWHQPRPPAPSSHIEAGAWPGANLQQPFLHPDYDSDRRRFLVLLLGTLPVSRHRETHFLTLEALTRLFSDFLEPASEKSFENEQAPLSNMTADELPDLVS